ncbi:MAG TPA: cytochrome C oxidase subunit I [Burkholderiales bacterium]|nr:cytochrome C oxidase subunit I [Burkholderiales bacterium]
MSSVTGENPERKKSGRIKLALLGAFFALPVAAGWLIWWLDLAPGTPGNYGTLLQPQPVALPDAGGLKGKWVLVQFDGGACAAACERKLYFMRQVRRAQGREMDRVARLWLLTDSVQPSPALLQAFEGTVIAPRGGIDAANGAFPAEGSVTDQIYLVDPLGNLMMRFPKDPDPKRVIQDLQRLLRASGFG